MFSGAEWYIKTDDDLMLDPFRLEQYFDSMLSSNETDNSFSYHCMDVRDGEGLRVDRDGKSKW